MNSVVLSLQGVVFSFVPTNGLCFFLCKVFFPCIRLRFFFQRVDFFFLSIGLCFFSLLRVVLFFGKKL